MSENLSRGAIISLIAGLPLVVASGSIALADTDDSSGTKKSFKYQTKPGPGGKDCAGCSFFKAPNACAIVKGKLSPKGYCISYAPKAK